MFDISEFSAIINPPQCGILAIGSGRPVIGNLVLYKTGKFKCLNEMCTFCFSPQW